ncbi:MAG: tyrosine-type recombinase/integrase [Terracidiphilus sp.]
MPLRERSGKWHFRFRLDGKRYEGTTGLAATSRNERKAQEMELDYRRALEEGRRPTRKVQVREFNDAVEDFLEWAKAHYREHPNSYKRIKTSLASAKEFFTNTPVSLIDEAKVEEYKTWRINEHEVRDITIRHDLHALSTFFRYAIRQRWTRENPISDVDIPSDADAVRMHIITPAEEKIYFQRAAKFPDLYDVGRVMLNQGMRPEEVASLAKVDLDLERGELHVRQGKSVASRRTLDMTSETRLILGKRMAGKSDWLFPSKRRKGQHIGRLNSAHDRLVKKAAKEGVTVNWVLYDLRHSFATTAAQGGVDLPTLAAILGHGSLRTVQKYVHPTAGHKKAAMVLYEEIQRKAAAKAEQEGKIWSN